METKRATVWLGLLSVALFGAGCSGRGSEPTKLHIVATNSVLGDLVANVAGQTTNIVVLVGPDGDPHTFEPTPKDGVAVAEASVIFENGAGLEPWLDKLATSAQTKARRVVVSKGLKLRHEPGEEGKQEEDPHVWHDVQNARHMVEVIRDALVEIDPKNAATYRANAAAYLKQLAALDDWVKASVAELPADSRKLVTNHDTFGYFADRYGFQIVGSALSSASTEAADPSAAEFVKLVNAIKATKTRAIFAENVQNPKLIERLAREAGVKVGPELYTDALGPAGSKGATYEKMMRYNVRTIVDALKP